MWIEASTPLTIRRRSGDVRLLPGQPVDFPEAEALKLLDKAGDKVRAIAPVIHSGDLIEWQRGGAVQRGLVDFLHEDVDGATWAFVTLADRSWAAVNVRYTTVATAVT